MKKLIRVPELVNSLLVKNEAGQVITKENCYIQVPARFSNIGLGQVGVETIIYGCYALISESGKYTVRNINALIELNPSRTKIIQIDEVDYYQFEFDAYQVMMNTSSVVKRDAIIYNIFNEFLFKGKVPWYMEYEDLGKLLDTSKELANSDVGKNQDVIEFIVSMISRNKNDRTINIRHILNSYKDLHDISYVPLSSVFYSVNTTINKLSGSYFNDGIVSALVKKTDDTSEIEKILRA